MRSWSVWTSPSNRLFKEFRVASSKDGLDLVLNAAPNTLNRPICLQRCTNAGVSTKAAWKSPVLA